MSAPRRAVLLDRDGTLIDFVHHPTLGVVTSAFDPSQLRLLPGVLEGLRLLVESGFTLAIATNQPGAAKAQFPRTAIDQTNAALVDLLRSDGIPIARLAVCYHHPEGAPGRQRAHPPCECRKPRPGMLLSLMASLGLTPDQTVMVGDTLADLGAGRAAGTRTALLEGRTSRGTRQSHTRSRSTALRSARPRDRPRPSRPRDKLISVIRTLFVSPSLPATPAPENPRLPCSDLSCSSRRSSPSPS
ncbi:MAG: HAD-IIIA family hydrolase [Polyangiaceae bacterium]